MRIRILLVPVLAAALLAISASAAQAGAFVLTLTDGVNTVTINDNLPGGLDTKPALDQVGGTNVAVGSFTVTNILGAMFYGVNAPVQMSITNFRVTSTGGGTLSATLSRQGLSAGSLGLGSAVVGVGSANMNTGFGIGTIGYASYINNTPVFASTMPGGTLNGAPTPVVLGQDSFSLLTRLDFTFSGAGVLGGSSGLQVLNDPTTTVPEPMTLLLLGPGMVGLTALRRRRRSKAL